MPTKIVFGSSSLEKLPEIVDANQYRSIFLVTGKNSMKKLGVTDKVINCLNPCKVHLYDDVPENPTFKDMQEALDYLHNCGSQLVIGLGGGSAMDVAKAAAILRKNTDVSVEDYFFKKEGIKNKGLPLIEIPTTAGTSSEVTPFSVAAVPEKNTKVTLSHDYMFPDIALIDPELTLSLPKYQTACTGIDALSHSVEAYWAKKSNPVSKGYALMAIREIFSNLERVCNELNDIDAREGMSKACVYAGLAFSNTKTTAAHSISYPLTIIHKVPHGLACGLTLPSLMLFNSAGSDCASNDVMDIAIAAGGSSIGEGAYNINKLMKNTGLPTSLGELGIKKEDIKTIVEYGFSPARMANNPREVTKEDLEKMLAEIY